MFTLPECLNLLGLALITVGSICAARAAPTTTYNADGSVSLAAPGLGGEGATQRRIEMHHRQKHFPLFLWMVACGAAFQALAVVVPRIL